MALFAAANNFRLLTACKCKLLARSFSQLLLQGKEGTLKDVHNNVNIQPTRCLQLTAVVKDQCDDRAAPKPCHKKIGIKEPCSHIRLPVHPMPCKKICLPCCKVINQPSSCDVPIVRQVDCSGVDYKFPSFAESSESIGCNLTQSDCCSEVRCRQINYIGRIKKLEHGIAHQRRKLGILETSKRFYTTSARRFSSKAKTCDRPDKEGETRKLSGPPCLKKDESKTAKKNPHIGKVECKKVCVPCCKPARDPPDCSFPYIKPECKKMKAPRPSFSECQSEKMKIIQPCECSLTILKRCSVSDSEDKAGCKKKK